MVYSTSKCPKCGKIVKRQTNPVHVIGNPFEHCRWCGSVYLNSYKEEWITKSPFDRFFFFLQVGVWARAFILPPIFLFLLNYLFDMNGVIVFILWPILSIGWLVMGYFVHKNASKNAITQSLNRTRNLEYLDSLKKAGYTIYHIHENPPKNTNTLPTQASVNEGLSHICLSNSDDTLTNIRNGIHGEDIRLQTPNTPPPIPKESFPINVIADGLAELCIKELVDIMGICHKYQVPYDDKKLIISTFSYYYTIWLYNFENITVGQADDIQEIYINHFRNFNRKNFEDCPFREVLENEELFLNQLKHIDRRVRNSFQSNNHVFVDDGISDEFILEFINNANDKEKIKSEIAYKILKNWAYVAHETGKQSTITK